MRVAVEEDAVIVGIIRITPHVRFLLTTPILRYNHASRRQVPQISTVFDRCGTITCSAVARNASVGDTMKSMKFAMWMVTLFGVASSPIYANSQEQNIHAIRQQYNIINSNLRHYSQVERDLMGYSTEGGELKAYLKDSSPRKVSVQFFGCRHQIQEEYYFWDNRLVFVYQVRLSDTGLPSRKILSRTENRFYFKQGHLVRWLGSNKKQRQITNSEGRQQERTLLHDSREWLAVAKKPSSETT